MLKLCSLPFWILSVIFVFQYVRRTHECELDFVWILCFLFPTYDICKTVYNESKLSRGYSDLTDYVTSRPNQLSFIDANDEAISKAACT